ncbi:sigma-70 family RNA polymerase sigma factor [Oleiagrimonas sp. C23AA]|uniref:sigma-70 family RNA polymerase sigma factor n=1 Tax=Oleiagrimonas sp. C23AA TaxID=2719047 RepID=UPI001420476E|nr:sigma-70 family RNA polymerase sigma factor [Oleiagrimonas sp. C23AA]
MSPRQRQFESLTRAHAGDLYRFAFWLCGQSALAEDLVQETLLRAWRNMDSLREAAAAKPWLMTILRREHARLYERKRLDTIELDDVRVADDGAWASPERHGQAADIRAAMSQLPLKYREPLAMQVLGGFSCEEIAAELGEKPGAVATQLFRARQKLKTLLQDDPMEATDHGLS